MRRTIAGIGVLACVCGAVFAEEPKFEIADVHASPGRNMRGPFAGGGRFEIRTATMLDLIRYAYTVDADKIYGGPNWLEFDRYDIFARLAPGTNGESRKTMLQALLAERFKLAVHNDTKPMPVYALTAGKHAGLKEADPAGETGCKAQPMRMGPREVSVDGPMMFMPVFEFICHNTTMQSLAEQIWRMPGATQYLNNRRVIDHTGLKGAWDFTLHYSLQLRGIGAPGAEITTIFEAVDKQLGLKLESATEPMAVLVVDSVNRAPIANSPEALKSLPEPPQEFDVAEIKPSQPAQNNGPMSGFVMLNGMTAVMRNGRIVSPVQNGRVELPNYTLKSLITLAWDLQNDTLAELPKFADSDKWDVIAKLPTANGPYEGNSDMDTLRPMLRKLLVDKFQIKFHNEDRPANAYTLMAVKPKLKPADPTTRTKWINGPGPDGKDPRDANPSLARLVYCQNMTMAQFAEALPTIAGGYLTAPPLDKTSLEGAWDFTLSFSPLGMVNGGGRGGRMDASGAAAASDPSGGLSLFDALTKQLGLKLEQQKRPAPVMVIDHIEPKPVDN